MAAGASRLTVLVLAAGQGTRFRSKTIKLLHPVAGRPMLEHVLDAADRLRPSRLVVVVGHQAERVRQALGKRADFVLQREQLGTGHAVMSAARRIESKPGSTLLILNGDLPLLRPETLKRLVQRHRRTGSALSLLTTQLDEPGGYGRIVRALDGQVERIVEARDATPEQARIREVNCGIYCADPRELLPVLRRLRPDNAQGEYYITDAVHHLIDHNKKVSALCHDDAEELNGVNNRAELAAASRTLFERKAEQLMADGVTLLDSARTWIDPRARIGRDTLIYPDVVIEGASVLGEDCIVRPGCRLVQARVGDGVEIKDHSIVLESRIGDRVEIGPFAHVRPGSNLGPDCKVGNFVELKKTRLGRGTKANHLAYLGDTTTGAECNIGAGTITCNYDGVSKNPTTLGRGVFIGSDTKLIAPVRVRDGAYVAAGSTVTEDVPRGALAIARTRQKNIEGWVERKMSHDSKKKRSRSR